MFAAAAAAAAAAAWAAASVPASLIGDAIPASARFHRSAHRTRNHLIGHGICQAPVWSVPCCGPLRAAPAPSDSSQAGGRSTPGFDNFLGGSCGTHQRGASQHGKRTHLTTTTTSPTATTPPSFWLHLRLELRRSPTKDHESTTRLKMSFGGQTPTIIVLKEGPLPLPLLGSCPLAAAGTPPPTGWPAD